MANDQDEIEKLPIKERLECKRLQAETQKHQAETREHEKSIWGKPAIYGVIAPTALALIVFPVTGYYSGWFDVKQKRLENQRILLEAETKKLEKEKVLLEIKNENIEREYEDKNKKLVKEYKKKNDELEEQYEEKLLKLDEKLNNIEKEQNELINLRLYLKDRLVDIKMPVTKETKEILEQYKGKLAQVKTEDKYSFDDWYYKGAAEFNGEKYVDAITSFTRAIEIDPKNPYAYNYRGACYGRRVEFKKAIEDYNESIRLKPDNPLPHLNKARIHIRSGEIDVAEDEIAMVKDLFKEGKVNEGEKAFIEKEIELVVKKLEKAKKERKEIIK